MNKCPKCGKMFEGNFCPECGSSPTGERLCPNCKKKIPTSAKFCSECGFTLTPQVQPKAKKKRNNAVLSWIKSHKTPLGCCSAALVVVLILVIVIPVAVHNRHNGTYYLYANEEYNYEKYFILDGNSYTDEKGYSCDVEFDGDTIKMYAELFGMKDVTAEGTINDDILKLKIMGAEVIYAKDGHQHSFKKEVIKEATCEEEGISISSCFCGFGAGKTNTIPALGHNFGKDHLCKRCGIGNGALLEFALNEEETAYTIKGIGTCKDNVIIIPNKHKGLPVTSIGERAFSSCDQLTSITIPESITSIGEHAFSSCDQLTSITIPDSVTSIGEAAFCFCRGLTEITIPNGVTEIGDLAFENCDGLTSVLWNAENCQDAGAWNLLGDLDFSNPYFNNSFRGCTNLKTVVFGQKVETIPFVAFIGCDELTEFKVDENNRTLHVENNCLIETKNKTLILGCKISQIPDDGSVTSIGDGAFLGCSGLTSVIIPDSVTEIGECAFAHCNGLTSVTIGSSVTSIGDGAFLGCNGLTSVTIGSGVTSIGMLAFAGCNSLREVYFANPNGWKLSWNEDMSGATTISGLEDPTKAAEYLNGNYTYWAYYWKREG